MAKMMTKTQIAGHIANKFELSKKQSTEILMELANLAAKQAKNGFVFPGVGKLVIVNRKARMGRNPQTGEAIQIKAKTVAKFYVAKAVKDAIAPPKK
jgi:DNA-binding protein HU-beta